MNPLPANFLDFAFTQFLRAKPDGLPKPDQWLFGLVYEKVQRRMEGWDGGQWEGVAEGIECEIVPG